LQTFKYYYQYFIIKLIIHRNPDLLSKLLNWLPKSHSCLPAEAGIDRIHRWKGRKG